jgi:hypothetical protein
MSGIDGSENQRLYRLEVKTGWSNLFRRVSNQRDGRRRRRMSLNIFLDYWIVGKWEGENGDTGWRGKFCIIVKYAPMVTFDYFEH